MFIEVPGARLFAVRGGPKAATAILAVGGWIGSSELWLETLADLSDAYQTVAYDHRGFACALTFATWKLNPGILG